MAKLPLAISRQSGWRITMANDQNGNDGNRADSCANRVVSGQSDMGNISKPCPTGEGAGAVAWLIGAFEEKGRDLICQVWSDSEHIYTIVYKWNEVSQCMEHVYPHGNVVAQSSTDVVTWLVGDFDGDTRDEVCMVWEPNPRDVEMNVYSLCGNLMTKTSQSTNSGHGPDATAWLVGKICEVGAAEQICQVYESSGRVGMTIWGLGTDNQGNAEMKAIWDCNDMNEGPGHLAWLIGDVNGDGLDEIIQVWNDDTVMANGRVAMIVYGWAGDDDNSGMKVLWSDDIARREGPTAEAWLIGDLNGDGRAKIVQIYPHSGMAAAIVYGWQDASNGMEVIAQNTDLGEAQGGSWLVGDVYGNGEFKVCQIWKNASDNLGMSVYSWDGYNLNQIWNNDMGVTGEFESILVGNVNDKPGENICQLINDNGGLNIAVYGNTSN
jgi:hypothetical protein